MANNPPILLHKIPLTAEQTRDLQSLFTHPGFSILKQVIAATAVDFQVRSMNAALYPDHEAASELSATTKESAQRIQAVLDELDALEVNPGLWSLAELMIRR
jgi:hypothetical protein